MSNEYNFHCVWKSNLSFEGQRFSGMEISDAYLADGDLSGVELQGSVFRRCNFAETDFSGADLDGCLFRGCDLSGAIFEDVTGNNVNFTESRLQGVSFRDSDLDDFHILDCNGWLFFDGATMKRAHLNNCVIPYSSFMGTDLTGAMLVGCNLTGTLFNEDTCLTGVIMDRSNITDARMLEAIDAADVGLHLVTALPWVSKDSIFVPSEVQRPHSRQSVNEASTSIYGGKNLIAHLYCADAEEFKEACQS